MNQVWILDFNFDRTTNGHSLKWLSMVDEYTRRHITLDKGRSITSEDLSNFLAELFMINDVPEFNRSDSGLEFIAKSLQQWLLSLEVKTLQVEHDSPWQNEYAESCHSRFRDELLRVGEFESVRHAGAHAAAWRDD